MRKQATPRSGGKVAANYAERPVPTLSAASFPNSARLNSKRCFLCRISQSHPLSFRTKFDHDSFTKFRLVLAPLAPFYSNLSTLNIARHMASLFSTFGSASTTSRPDRFCSLSCPTITVFPLPLLWVVQAPLCFGASASGSPMVRASQSTQRHPSK